MSVLSQCWMAPITGFRNHLEAACRSEQTMVTRMHQLDRLARAFPRGPDTVTDVGLEAWLAKQNWAAETRRGMRTCLRTFFRWARRHGYCAVDPAKGLPSVKRPVPCPHPVADVDWKAVRDASGPRVALMIDLAAQMGLRRGEIAQVHRGDVVEDLFGFALVVRGKGGKKRVLPMPDAIAYRVLAAAGWVFPSDEPGRHLTADRVGRLIRDASRGRWTAHQLRHRFATIVFGRTGDLVSTQRLMGHASPVTTQGYVLLDRERLRVAALAAVA